MHRYRTAVMLHLGERCRLCSVRTDLQVHVHIDDAGAHHRWGSCQRWKYYLALAVRGDCSLLCRACHNRVSFVEHQHGRGSQAALAVLFPLAHQRPSASP